ncbi:MAG: carbamoyl phosphate synthase large subunit, partial [Candidatus Lambdaproteobacteria bacterium]|nr:carbamoyl phosphate synthase large subunit [Candidatus Lambdaproteobacteria bacterium]
PLVPFAVKETVFPFAKFPGSDLMLGPEMLSTGEVMGRGRTFAEAFIKSQIAAANSLRSGEFVFIGVRDEDKQAMVPLARSLIGLGYRIVATPGTRRALAAAGIEGVVETSIDPHAQDNLYRYMFDDSLTLVINTTRPRRRRIDPTHLRRMVLTYQVPYCTTVEAAGTMVRALAALGREQHFTYTPLKGYAPPATGASA